MTTVRSVHVDLVRSRARIVVTDAVDIADIVTRRDVLVDSDDSSLRVESHVLDLAMRSLPRRWQLVLWWSVVEREPLGEIGSRLGISPNAVAALKRRAREGLREAYLALDAEPDAEPETERRHADGQAVLR